MGNKTDFLRPGHIWSMYFFCFSMPGDDSEQLALVNMVSAMYVPTVIK